MCNLLLQFVSRSCLPPCINSHLVLWPNYSPRDYTLLRCFRLVFISCKKATASFTRKVTSKNISSMKRQGVMIRATKLNAWMLASMTKSSSPCDSSIQLFKFTSTAASENCWEQWPPLMPREHPHPAWRNCFTFPTISSLSINNSTWSPSSILVIWWGVVASFKFHVVVKTTRFRVEVDWLNWTLRYLLQNIKHHSALCKFRLWRMLCFDKCRHRSFLLTQRDGFVHLK